MSTGQATTRAHNRDREIRRQIMRWGGTDWRTPGEWHATLGPVPAFRLSDSYVNRACVGNELRRMQDQGLVERRVNPDDARSAQYRLTTGA